MTMLAASGFGIAKLADLDANNDVWKVWDYESFQRLRFHFTHPAWESITGGMGVSFWDMIQPCFMFMVGVAMPFSYARRKKMGSSATGRLLHAAFRSVVLTLMGVFLYSLNKSETNWIFTNVLSQIGLGYFFAYLALGLKPQIQIAAIAAILIGYWGLFVLNPPPEDFDYAAVNASAENGEVYEGRFAPWSKNSNVGHQFDLWLLNKLRQPDSKTDESVEVDGETPLSIDAVFEPAESESPSAAPDASEYIRRWWFSSADEHKFNRGGYVTLNFVPSIATMLFGILCGQLLMSRETNGHKLRTLLISGAICIALGVLAHNSVCPIVKRIWTPSWALFSGGYAMWMLALFYLLFDVLPLRFLAFPFVVVGMNSILMYLMGQMLKSWVRTKVLQTHFAKVFASFEAQIGSDVLAASPTGMGTMIAPTAVFAVFWLVAFWLYRSRCFVRV